MSSVNVGIIGVGNCASSLVQGVEYYSIPAEDPAGLTNPICAGYAVSDVRFTAAFDVNSSKIGRDLSEAIWVAPNNAFKFADVPHLGVPVSDGALSDGVGQNSSEMVNSQGRATLDDIVERLKFTKTHVVVNFLPVGSQNASELYAEAALRAQCAFINCIPSVIARSTDWSLKFETAGLPLLGDDLKSQFGATLVLSQLGFGICLRKGPIELSCLVGSVDGGGGNDGQGQIRGAAGTGTTGRAPATDPGWQKLSPSDR